MKRERRTLRILGKTYKVKWWDDMPGDFGACQPDELAIHISRIYPREEQITTVIHEALEAYNNKLGLKMKHELIDQLDGLIYAFLADQGIDMSALIEAKELNLKRSRIKVRGRNN